MSGLSSHIRPSGILLEVCLAAHLSESRGWTPANVKLLLPPRHGRGISRLIRVANGASRNTTKVQFVFERRKLILSRIDCRPTQRNDHLRFSTAKARGVRFQFAECGFTSTGKKVLCSCTLLSSLCTDPGPGRSIPFFERAAAPL